MVPALDLFLLGRSRRAHVVALVDSGAVLPVFHRQSAEDAGIVLPDAANYAVQYGGSITLARKIIVALELVGKRFTTEVAFVDKLELPYALLGRQGIFAKFNEVAFLEKAKTPRVEFRF